MDTIDKLRKILESIDGPATRQRIAEKRKLLKNPPTNRSITPPTPVELGEVEPQSASANSAHEDGSISALLLDLSRSSDVSRVAKDYVIGGEPLCLRIGQKATSKTVVAIVARVGDLSALGEKLSFWGGYRRFTHIFLAESPENPEITSATAIAICAPIESAVFELETWPTEIDPIALCSRVLGDLPGRRVHLFAKQPAPGWEAVIGDHNWATEPTSAEATID